ncbi:hypothetical protein [Polyangium fumosum]|uniref:Uncharacterized protein n=1 Tax=Polyangium fumosum TaxID=889272 RepID=A0A4U1J7Q4_9BACT|nr:hypothetical protein [Polyangium fumosum]TKD03401.1 hypothetical protein E8A74_25900 [Polyangium fumosum]
MNEQAREAATRLIVGMVRDGHGLHLQAEVREDRGELWIVFTGGKWGEHELCFSTYSPESIQKHWEGYCESNGFVTVPSSGPIFICPHCHGEMRAQDYPQHMFAVHIRLADPVSDTRVANCEIASWNDRYPDHALPLLEV